MGGAVPQQKNETAFGACRFGTFKLAGHNQVACMEVGRAALAVAEKFLALTKPTLVNGRWRKPVLNARIVNRLRKEAAVEGSFKRHEMKRSSDAVSELN